MMTSHERTISRSARLAGVTVALCAASLTLACSELFEDPFGISEEDCGTVKVPISGQWSLTGRGSRSGCDNPDRDGDITVANSTAWTVSEGSAGTTLLIDTGSSTAQIEETTLNNACVTFRTREVLPGDGDGATEIVIFEWEAAKEGSSDLLLGNFSGDSTDGCSYSGRFEVQIR